MTTGQLQETSEEQFAAHVSRLARMGSQSELLRLFDERNAAYLGHSAPAIARMRGWLLLAYSHETPVLDLSDCALPYVLEELQTAHDAYLTTAALICLRSWHQPDPAFCNALSGALSFARGHDLPVCTGEYGGIGLNGNTSPMRELAATLHWMGDSAAPMAAELHDLVRSRAATVDVLRQIESLCLSFKQGDACCSSLPFNAILGRLSFGAARPTGIEALDAVVFEDQMGVSSTCQQIFQGHPTIVAFFYSRCDNPLKCSLTIWKLARTQGVLAARGLASSIATVGITYDSAYDTPDRLLRYGHNRGLKMDGHNKLIRTTSGFAVLRRYFDLGVSFFESLVSRHPIEVFVLDRDGRIAFSYTRLNWSEEIVVSDAASLLSARQSGNAGSLSAAMPAPGLLASFVPKCPVCWVGYMNSIGLTGWAFATPSQSTLLWLAAGLLMIHLALAFWRVRTVGWRISQALSLVGAAFLAANLAWAPKGFLYAGIALMLAASLTDVRQTTSQRPGA
jgi:protein SCO1/2